MSHKLPKQFSVCELADYVNFSAFPKDCFSYNGLNSIDCLVNIFEKGGCLRTGEAHPLYLQQSQLQRLNSSTLP